jgi:hypothetical protein
MRPRNHIGTLLALAGLFGGGVIGAPNAGAVQSAAVAASKSAVKEEAKVQRQAPKHLRARFDRMHGSLSNRFQPNQRQKRKDARRAWAAGDKKAFA